ncbi:MAG TPA: DNA (cytosine-5-)-methyltransferase [Solirubrobacterales bacterium]
MSHYELGTNAPWYRGRELTEQQRATFRARSQRSHQAKLHALAGRAEPIHPVNVPTFDPRTLMPEMGAHGLAALSLFSGGGGLDLGFDRAGYSHLASYDTLAAAGETLRSNRPGWVVHAGEAGDVRVVDWRSYKGAADIIHGGPPCQPFSTAGRQKGARDGRNLLPEFVQSVLAARPQAFVAENVAALSGPKFQSYLKRAFYRPLSKHYHVETFLISAQDFGVPQIRRRVVFVGFRRKRDFARFKKPEPNHCSEAEPLEGKEVGTGARAALGLPPTGYDAAAPTIRSTLTGPRHTTSILSSVSAQRAWERLGIWPNGVAADRAAASAFPAKNGHFRLSVPDCALLQGFPEDWRFHGATYMALGQIGNSVAPPVAYAVAMSVAKALHGRHWSASR